MSISTIIVAILEMLDDVDFTDTISAEVFHIAPEKFEDIVSAMCDEELVSCKYRVGTLQDGLCITRESTTITPRGVKYLYEMKAIKLVLKQQIIQRV